MTGEVGVDGSFVEKLRKRRDAAMETARKLNSTGGREDWSEDDETELYVEIRYMDGVADGLLEAIELAEEAT